MTGPIAAVMIHVADPTAGLNWYEQAFVGAELYRGPLDMGDGQRMAQVRDPWGNLIGLRGPHTA